ncbi:hypothetical protein M409DRAFT_26589 [Zasmidium cellare ATCC 36951]|uniref:Uncharacterized protein n=1 Tax=Zasmidium cellare ATCC 36951 TaxID=1080233 RepID=A0A6A6C7R5_ZASCE|nr:uncharacterized protein M409DRAFT_26589 [Zasmidium cellare ATCC 36951]KAF2163144.1 hypothetical protein M409DRAFT_26589 [Zasmidium cellare ATCC 36951]
MLRLGALAILLVNGVLGDSWTLSFYTATQFDAGSCTGDTNDNPPVCCHGDWSNVKSVQLTGAADAIALVSQVADLMLAETQTAILRRLRVIQEESSLAIRALMNVNDFDNSYNNKFKGLSAMTYRRQLLTSPEGVEHVSSGDA